MRQHGIWPHSSVPRHLYFSTVFTSLHPRICRHIQFGARRFLLSLRISTYHTKRTGSSLVLHITSIVLMIHGLWSPFYRFCFFYSVRFRFTYYMICGVWPCDSLLGIILGQAWAYAQNNNDPWSLRGFVRLRQRFSPCTVLISECSTGYSSGVRVYPSALSALSERLYEKRTGC